MSAAPPLSIIVTDPSDPPRLALTVASIGEQRRIRPETILVRPGASVAAAAGPGPDPVPIAAVVAAAPPHNAAAAWNAGLAAAQGEWVLLLAAGDRLVGDMVLSEALNWVKRTEAGVAAGEVAYDSGRISRLRSRVNPVARDFLASGATFYRRALFAENGAFETSLAAMAAYELHVRLWKNRVRFKPIPLRIAAVAAEPVYDSHAFREEVRVRHRYFPGWRCAWWDALSALRWARGRLTRRLHGNPGR